MPLEPGNTEIKLPQENKVVASVAAVGAGLTLERDGNSTSGSIDSIARGQLSFGKLPC
jgi:hypothetical protein